MATKVIWLITLIVTLYGCECRVPGTKQQMTKCYVHSTHDSSWTESIPYGSFEFADPRDTLLASVTLDHDGTDHLVRIFQSTGSESMVHEKMIDLDSLGIVYSSQPNIPHTYHMWTGNDSTNGLIMHAMAVSTRFIGPL